MVAAQTEAIDKKSKSFAKFAKFFLIFFDKIFHFFAQIKRSCRERKQIFGRNSWILSVEIY